MDDLKSEIKDARPLRRDDQPQNEAGFLGETNHVIRAKNADASSTETTVSLNGDKDSVRTDAEGRETERIKSHRGPFGEDQLEEKRVTTYDTKTGWPEAVTIKYDNTGKATEQTQENAFGNSYTERYGYGVDGRRYVSEELALDRAKGVSTRIKYNDQHQPTEKDTSYATGRSADHEDFLYGENGKLAMHLKNNEVLTAPSVIDSVTARIREPQQQSVTVAEAVVTWEERAQASIENLVSLDSASKQHVSDRSSQLQPTDRATERVSETAGVKQVHDRLDAWADKQIADVEKAKHELEKDKGKNQEQLITLNLEIAQLEKFKANINNFEARASKDCPGEIENTLKQLDRLTSAAGEAPMPSLDRRHIAEQIIKQAAEPQSIDQGQHNTCNVTALESRTYSRTPSAAAKLVVDVCLDGRFEGADKKQHPIPVVNLHPKQDDEAKEFPTTNGSRSYASEIFQEVAVNIHYRIQHDRDGSDIEYRQEPSTKDNHTGEVLWDKKNDRPVTDRPFGDPMQSPNLEDKDYADINKAITGKDEGKDVLIVNDKNCDGPKENVVIVHSEKEFRDELARLKREHKLPVILRVNSECDPFCNDSGRGDTGERGEYHAVTITDYDEKTQKVSMDNEWGAEKDHLAAKSIPVSDLYIATLKTKDAIEALEHNSDPIKKMEHARLRLADGKWAAKEEAQQLLKEEKEAWKKLTPDERKDHEAALVAMLGRLYTADRIRCLQDAYSSNMLTDKQFADQLLTSELLSLKEHKQKWPTDVAAQQRYKEEQDAYIDGLAELFKHDLALAKLVATLVNEARGKGG